MESDLHFDGINFPVNKTDIDKFEEIINQYLLMFLKLMKKMNKY